MDKEETDRGTGEGGFDRVNGQRGMDEGGQTMEENKGAGMEGYHSLWRMNKKGKNNKEGGGGMHIDY